MTLRTIGCTTVIRVPTGQESPEFGVQVLDATGAPKDGAQVTFECEDNSAVEAASNRPSITVKTANGGYGYAKFRARRPDTATFSVRISAPGEQEHIAVFQQVPLVDATDPTPPREPPRAPGAGLGKPMAAVLIALIVVVGVVLLANKWLNKSPASAPVTTIVTPGGGSGGDGAGDGLASGALQQHAEEERQAREQMEGNSKAYADEKLRQHDRVSHRRWDMARFLKDD